MSAQAGGQAGRVPGPVPPAADVTRRRRGWVLQDWANSAFSTTVVAALAGPYVTALADEAAGDGPLVELGPLTVAPGSWYPYVVSASVLVQVLLLPVLGALADRTGDLLRPLAGCVAVGGLATAGLLLTGGDDWLLAGLLFGFANVASGASFVLYNALLPEICPPDDRDRLSSRGYAAGYAGGALLLVANLALVVGHDVVGISEGLAVRLSLASAGAWWLGFGLLSVALLRRAPGAAELPAPQAPTTSTPGALLDALRELRRLPQTARFLVAYLLYNDAVSAVIALAAVFVTQELFVADGQEAEDAAGFLLALILLIQVVAVAGALGFGRLAGRIGAKRAVEISLVIWIAVVVYAFALLDSLGGAVALGVAVGVVLGGSQALSRSLFSRLLPEGREASFFGFYEIASRGTSWVAPLLFGAVVGATGSYRLAILSLVVLFVAGLAVLTRVDVDRGVEEAAAR